MTQTRTFPARSSLGGPSTANDGSLRSAEVGSHAPPRVNETRQNRFYTDDTYWFHFLFFVFFLHLAIWIFVLFQKYEKFDTAVTKWADWQCSQLCVLKRACMFVFGTRPLTRLIRRYLKKDRLCPHLLKLTSTIWISRKWQVPQRAATLSITQQQHGRMLGFLRVSQQRFPTFLAPRTGLMSDSVFRDWPLRSGG